MTLILFLIILGALVFVHELGHFIAAKRAGIRVDEFALGFPPTVLGKRVGETIYRINLIPFGGYVKIFGEDGPDGEQKQNGASIAAGEDSERRLAAKPKLIQAAVLASGVLGNIVFAWLLISASFLSGIPSSVEGRYAAEVENRSLVITSVLPGSPAERAGLKSGDRLLRLEEGERVFAEVDAERARQFIGESSSALSVSYLRGEERKTATVLPAEGIVPGKLALGVSLDEVGTVRFGPLRSAWEGFLTTLDLTREVAVGMSGFIADAFRGKADLSSIAGPVGIAGLVGEARGLGFVYLLSFTAFISVNLAVINLLPLPALDGGRLLFLAIEAALRRPIPARVSRALNTAGFALLILFMLVITYRDILKLFP